MSGPGVIISTSTRTGPSTATVRESSQLFVVGLASRGPANTAVLVQSIAEFEDIFGGYRADSYLQPTVETFFEEGGTQVYVARTVGASATVGSLELLNAANVEVATITANGPGSWSSSIGVEVVHPSNATMKVNLYSSGDLVYSTGTVSSTAQAVGRINSSAIAARYVTATLEAAGESSTYSTQAAAVTPTGNPVELAPGNENLSGVTEGRHILNLNSFNDSFGTGAVTIADSFTTTTAAALITHANAYSRIAILCGALSSDAAAIKAAAVLARGEDHSEHAALYWPWIEIPTSINGVTRIIPPLGYVAAKRAVAHNQTGPHLPAAGLLSAARFVLGLTANVDKTVSDDLDEAGVNVLRIIQNTVRVYGARSLSADETNFRYITQQDVVNSITTECYRSLEDLVFSTIDGRNTIFANIEARLVVILAAMRDLGALYPAFSATGKQLDNGYTVKCDTSINPTTQLATGLVKAKVGIRVSSVGDQIQIDIVKSNLSQSVI